MSKMRINKRIYERCLLTEVVPYETPIVFSNWGSFNFENSLRQNRVPSLLRILFKEGRSTIPYKYFIKKDSESIRALSLIHPKTSRSIVDFYQRFELQVLKKNKKSSFSIRYPFEIATTFKIKGDEKDDLRYLENIGSENVYGSSYFSYKLYPHLYKFFDSDQFTELEKAFLKIQYLDISNCFSSIYTHSISWAIRGKKITKENLRSSENGFDNTLDKLMQNVNYQETNGILVGPEFSRIFAELILQEIDRNIEEKLNDLGFEHSKDYWFCRYIDDYYIFFNDDKFRREVISIISRELEIYKLYLNKGKSKVFERPFITDVSVVKLELSSYLNTLIEELKNGRRINSYKELNRIRSIISSKEVDVSALSSFFITSLNNKIFEYSPIKTEDRLKYYLFILEMAFHIFRMDIRVNNTYKIVHLVLDVLKKVEKFKKNLRGQFFDKIYFEFLNAIEFSIKEGGVVECMNLLILVAELGENKYFIPTDIIDSLLSKCREEHQDEYSNKDRLGYFEICSFLYYFQNHDKYKTQKAEILLEAQEVICTFDPSSYAEVTYLLIDLVACPYISKNEKNNLIQSAYFHSKNALITNSEIGFFRNFIEKHKWYFNWNQEEELMQLVQKKKLHLSY